MRETTPPGSPARATGVPVQYLHSDWTMEVTSGSAGFGRFGGPGGIKGDKRNRRTWVEWFTVFNMDCQHGLLKHCTMDVLKLKQLSSGLDSFPKSTCDVCSAPF